MTGTFGDFIARNDVPTTDPAWWWNWFDSPVLAEMALAAYEYKAAGLQLDGDFPLGVQYMRASGKAYTRSVQAARDYGWDSSVLRNLPWYLANIYARQRGDSPLTAPVQDTLF